MRPTTKRTSVLLLAVLLLCSFVMVTMAACSGTAYESIRCDITELKTEYVKGDALDLSKLKVTGIKKDGENVLLTPKDYNTNPTDGTLLNEVGKVTVTVSLKSKPAVSGNFKVNVSAANTVSLKNGAIKFRENITGADNWNIVKEGNKIYFTANGGTVENVVAIGYTKAEVEAELANKIKPLFLFDVQEAPTPNSLGDFALNNNGARDAFDVIVNYDESKNSATWSMRADISTLTNSGWLVHFDTRDNPNHNSYNTNYTPASFEKKNVLTDGNKTYSLFFDKTADKTQRKYYNCVTVIIADSAPSVEKKLTNGAIKFRENVTGADNWNVVKEGNKIYFTANGGTVENVVASGYTKAEVEAELAKTIKPLFRFDVQECPTPTQLKNDGFALNNGGARDAFDVIVNYDESKNSATWSMRADISTLTSSGWLVHFDTRENPNHNSYNTNYTPASFDKKNILTEGNKTYSLFFDKTADKTQRKYFNCVTIIIEEKA